MRGGYMVRPPVAQARKLPYAENASTKHPRWSDSTCAPRS